LINGKITTHFQTGTAETAGHNWKMIWLIPCIMAIVVTAAFAVLFKENSKPPAEQESLS
jgi:hypothetical protein